MTFSLPKQQWPMPFILLSQNIFKLRATTLWQCKTSIGGGVCALITLNLSSQIIWKMYLLLLSEFFGQFFLANASWHRVHVHCTVHSTAHCNYRLVTLRRLYWLKFVVWKLFWNKLSYKKLLWGTGNVLEQQLLWAILYSRMKTGGLNTIAFKSVYSPKVWPGWILHCL